MSKLFPVLLFMVFTSTSLIAQPVTEVQKQEVEAYLDELIDEEDPGFAIGAIKDGEVIFEEYRGLASLHHNVQVDRNTKFNIASVAKQFTALMVLELHLEGKLNLQDDFRTYLPDFYPEISDSILIRHLINHTSGVRDFYDLMSIQQDPWWRQEGLDNEDALELLMKQKDLNFEPGSDYMYSNSNYTIMTKLVEVVSGMPFHEYSSGFFQRVGMPNSEFNKNYMYVISDLAIPYADWGNGIWQQYPHITNLFGDGFLYTTLPDQLAFELSIQNADVSNTELLKISQKPIAQSEITHYGFGLELQDRLGRKAVHHSGGTGANHAQTVRFIDDDLTIVVMSNNSTIWSGYIADKIANILLPKVDTNTDKENGLIAASYEANTDIEQLVGEYKSPEGSIIRIRSNEGKLYWRIGNNNQVELKREFGNIFHFHYNENIKLGFTDAQFVVYYPGEEPRAHTKMKEFDASKNYLLGLTGTYINNEIDATFELSLTDVGTLMLFNQSLSDEKLEVEILQEDELILYDYLMKVERNEIKQVDEILLTYNRVKNLRFVKAN